MVSYTTCMIQMPLLVREPKGKKAVHPSDIAELCKDMMDFAVESFHVISVNPKNVIIDRVSVSMGLVDSCLVHPREVFRAAIIANASSVFLVHNHPSGDCTPSSEDLKITRQLIESGKILNINVIDHLIIGHDDDWALKFFSIRESGCCTF